MKRRVIIIEKLIIENIKIILLKNFLKIQIIIGLKKRKMKII